MSDLYKMIGGPLDGHATVYRGEYANFPANVGRSGVMKFGTCEESQLKKKPKFEVYYLKEIFPGVKVYVPDYLKNDLPEIVRLLVKSYRP